MQDYVGDNINKKYEKDEYWFEINILTISVTRL